MTPTYVDALRTAVLAGKGENGRTNPAAIGVHLKEHGRSLEESGCTSLTEALHAAGLFEMRDIDNASKEFRLRKGND